MEKSQQQHQNRRKILTNSKSASTDSSEKQFLIQSRKQRLNINLENVNYERD